MNMNKQYGSINKQQDASIDKQQDIGINKKWTLNQQYNISMNKNTWRKHKQTKVHQHEQKTGH